MNSASDDAKRLRVRESELRESLVSTAREPTAGAPTLVAKTTKITTYPTSAASFFGCTPQTVLGTETEGASGTLTAGTQTFLALNLGTVAPPVGTAVIVTFVANRWVFRYDG
jgi:hypothetical protein